jgi:hypothetical protein
MSEHTSAGFPGCLGSTDGVHISWDRCHAMQKMLHTGRNRNNQKEFLPEKNLFDLILLEDLPLGTAQENKKEH